MIAFGVILFTLMAGGIALRGCADVPSVGDTSRAASASSAGASGSVADPASGNAGQIHQDGRPFTVGSLTVQTAGSVWSDALEGDLAYLVTKVSLLNWTDAPRARGPFVLLGSDGTVYEEDRGAWIHPNGLGGPAPIDPRGTKVGAVVFKVPRAGTYRLVVADDSEPPRTAVVQLEPR